MTRAPFAQSEGATPAPSTSPAADLHAIYNIEDDTIRLTCTNPDDRFPSQLLADAKAAGYRLWRGSRQLVAIWSPDREDFARLYAGEVRDEVLESTVAARVARFESYRSSAEARSHQRSAKAIQGLAPMGEPVKLDHHSAKRHLRAIERSDQNMRAAVAEQKKAEYWAERAERTEAHAQNKERPTTIRNRIKGLEAEHRKLQRHQESHPSARTQRWLDHHERRIQHERARLERVEPTPPTQPKFEVGEVVWWPKFGRCELVSAGPKNCRVKILDGGATGMILRVARDELTVKA